MDSFFLDAVIDTAKSAIKIAKQINLVREEDMNKIHKLGKTAAITSVEVLRHLFKQPIIDVRTIQKWTKFSKVGAQKVIDRFLELGILSQRNLQKTYGRTYVYRTYLSLFHQEEHSLSE